jgi:subtilisin family serine protease
MPDSASSWGIVAPGGDPSGVDVSGPTTDYLHWIENIWTSTPYMSSPTDTTFEGNCGANLEYGEAGNCRTLLSGTSMATPHVAGAAALILSVNASYQSPTAMKQLLCTTADNIIDPHQGCGRLNVYRAVGTALGDPTP